MERSPFKALSRATRFQRIRVRDGDMVFFMAHRIGDVAGRNTSTVAQCKDMYDVLIRATETDGVCFKVHVTWRSRLTGWLQVTAFGKRLWVRDCEIIRQ